MSILILLFLIFTVIISLIFCGLTIYVYVDNIKVRKGSKGSKGPDGDNEEVPINYYNTNININANNQIISSELNTVYHINNEAINNIVLDENFTNGQVMYIINRNKGDVNLCSLCDDGRNTCNESCAGKISFDGNSSYALKSNHSYELYFLDNSAIVGSFYQD